MNGMKNNRRGLTLAELLITMIIVTILTVSGIALFQNFKIRPLKAEAKEVIGSMVTPQGTYFLKAQHYAATTGTYAMTPVDKFWKEMLHSTPEGTVFSFSIEAFGSIGSPQSTHHWIGTATTLAPGLTVPDRGQPVGATIVYDSREPGNWTETGW